MAHPIEEFQQYRDDLLARLGDDDPIEVLASSIEKVRSITEGVSGEAMEATSAPGEWSARHVLSHLYDTDLIYGVRVRMIVTEDRPKIAGYDQDLWIDRFGLLDETGRQTYLRWRWLRSSNVRMFRSLTPDELKKVGLHSERGEESADLMIRLLAGHDLIHIDQLAESLADVPRPQIRL